MDTHPSKLFLVTGGSGFLGINFIRHLLTKGHRVRSLDLAPFTYPEQNRVEAIVADVADPEAMDRAMQRVDMVVHCAAALPLYPPAQIIRTEVEGTRNVLTHGLKHGVERVIHISTTAVYGIPKRHPIYETDPLIGVGPYGQAKVDAEQLCMQFRSDKHMYVPVIRPKSFVGPERLGVFALLYDWARTGHNFPLLGNGKNRYQLLDVEDLCDAIYLCATLDKDRVNDVFNIGAREYLTMREDYQAVLDAAGFGKKIIGLPAAPAIWLLRFLEMLKLSPLYKWIYETAATDSFVSIEKAERVLGFNPRYSNKQALLRNYQWYLDNLSSFEGTAGISHRVPWKQGALAIAKLFF